MSRAAARGNRPLLASLLTPCAKAPDTPAALFTCGFQSLNTQEGVYALLLKLSLFCPSDRTLSFSQRNYSQSLLKILFLQTSAVSRTPCSDLHRRSPGLQAYPLGAGMQVLSIGRCLTTGLLSPHVLPSDQLHGDPKQDKKLVGVSVTNVKKTELYQAFKVAGGHSSGELLSSEAKGMSPQCQPGHVSKAAKVTEVSIPLLNIYLPFYNF